MHEPDAPPRRERENPPPELAYALKAFLRAAERARKTAADTGTKLVFHRDGRPVRVSAEEVAAETYAARNEP